MKLLAGLLLIVLGVAILRFRFQIHNFVGEWAWAQEYIGGTVNAISLFGALLIFVGVGYPFGVFEFWPPKISVGGEKI